MNNQLYLGITFDSKDGLQIRQSHFAEDGRHALIIMGVVLNFLRDASEIYANETGETTQAVLKQVEMVAKQIHDKEIVYESFKETPPDPHLS